MRRRRWQAGAGGGRTRRLQAGRAGRGACSAPPPPFPTHPTPAPPRLVVRKAVARDGLECGEQQAGLVGCQHVGVARQVRVHEPPGAVGPHRDARQRVEGLGAPGGGGNAGCGGAGRDWAVGEEEGGSCGRGGAGGGGCGAGDTRCGPRWSRRRLLQRPAGIGGGGASTAAIGERAPGVAAGRRTWRAPPPTCRLEGARARTHGQAHTHARPQHPGPLTPSAFDLRTCSTALRGARNMAHATRQPRPGATCFSRMSWPPAILAAAARAAASAAAAARHPAAGRSADAQAQPRHWWLRDALQAGCRVPSG